MTDEEFLKEKETMVEEWKQLIYDDEKQNYDVSNTGRIRYHDTQNELKLSKIPGMKNCYQFITITLNNGKKRRTGIHRLLAIMFIPIPYKYIESGMNLNKLVVDHIDDVKYHNIVTNIQWLTPSENTKKYFRTVKDLNDLIIEKDEVKKICEDLVKNKTIYEISQDHNVSELLVYDIRYGNRYKDISSKYEFPTVQLTEEDVIKICEKLQSGMSAKKVSDTYGYGIGAVAFILCRKTWTQISKDYEFPRSRIKDDIIHAICKRLEEGASAKEVANEFNVGKRLVQHIKWGDTHTDISSQYNIPKDKFKVSDDVIHAVCKDLASGEYNMNEIAERNGISRSFVKAIKYRKHRTDISDNYEW